MQTPDKFDRAAAAVLAKLDAWDAGARDEAVDEPDPAARAAVVAEILRRELG